MMAYTGIEVAIARHGVVAIVGIGSWTDSPRDFSMYFSSFTVMVGCCRGFSNDSHSQKQYHRHPMRP